MRGGALKKRVFETALGTLPRKKKKKKVGDIPSEGGVLSLEAKGENGF